jgi:hypothetical protein
MTCPSLTAFTPPVRTAPFGSWELGVGSWELEVDVRSAPRAGQRGGAKSATALSDVEVLDCPYRDPFTGFVSLKNTNVPLGPEVTMSIVPSLFRSPTSKCEPTPERL